MAAGRTDEQIAELERQEREQEKLLARSYVSGKKSRGSANKMEVPA